jgi:hypothetical protein
MIVIGVPGLQLGQLGAGLGIPHGRLRENAAFEPVLIDKMADQGSDAGKNDHIGKSPSVRIRIHTAPADQQKQQNIRQENDRGLTLKTSARSKEKNNSSFAIFPIISDTVFMALLYHAFPA